MRNLVQNFRNPKIVFAFFYDVSAASLTFWLALFLRYDSVSSNIINYPLFLKVYLTSVLIFSVSFVFNGLYKGIWRFSSTHDLIRVIRACLAGTVTSVLLWTFISRMHGIPRSLFPIQFFLVLVALGGGRFLYRYTKDRMEVNKDPKSKENVLIIGAGRAGEKLVRDIYSTPSLKLNVIGFIDDDRFKKNRLIHNVKVFGSIEVLPEVAEEYRIDKIFIAVPSATSTQIKKIVQYAKQCCEEIKILPKVDHILSSRVELSLLRNLKIEDLLGREQVNLDTRNLTSMIEGKTVLVSGAGGSIGSELCVQIAKFNPGTIVFVDYCELFLFELENKFKEFFPGTKIVAKIADIRDEAKMDYLFQEYRPDLVYHAAAYKHVPMMESNPLEAIGTNVRGSYILANLSQKYGAEKFTLISTDKAVNPTNVMGASKRIAEMVIAYFQSLESNTKFVAVRFGNVLGSNGSVIPIFKKQIEERKPLTVTHPEIIRYFMSIPEAAQLVIQASSMGQGGEIFVLDMGEPVKIVDLAKEMIRLAGLKEGEDVEIKFSGLRPGEKLFEELFRDGESYETTHHGKIRVALQSPLSSGFPNEIVRLFSLKTDEQHLLVPMIKSIVPEFTHFSLGEAFFSELDESKIN